MRRPHVMKVMTPLLLAVTACTDDSNPAGLARPVRTPGGALALVGPSPLGAPVAIGVETVADGFVSPIQLVHAPGNNGRRFVIDQVGVIWGLTPSGNRMPQPFLDISDRMVELRPQGDERGLLGLAFHPDFARNDRFFVFYNAPPRPSAPAGYNNTIVLSEFRTQGHSRSTPTQALSGGFSRSITRRPITTAARWRSVPMATSTSPSATAAVAMTKDWATSKTGTRETQAGTARTSRRTC